MKIARLHDKRYGDSYGLISSDGKKIATRAEIQEQTGIPIPPSVKEFMFKGWIEEINEYKN